MDYLLISVITLGILSLLDVITTVMALRIPDVYEANPIVRWLMEHTGWGWVTIKLAFTGWAGWYGITGKSFENNSVS